MEAYTDFASVYDIFMDDTPYRDWAETIAELIETYGLSRPVRKPKQEEEKEEKPKKEKSEEGTGRNRNKISEEDRRSQEKNLVLDLGCGTGTLTELLAQKGYDMIGIDNSEEMLNLAMHKKRESGSDILYLCQDMRDIDLYSTVGTVISVCDCVNYLLEEEEIEDTFRLVNNYLYPGGLFIFDFNTVYKYKTVIGDTTIAENREECSFIWENYYHEEEHINEYEVTVFVKEEKKRELFRRFTETHYQRGYTFEEMKGFVERAGMKMITAFDADTGKEPKETSERIYLLARECEKDKAG